jgi:Secretion system C-terminal sorting domain/Beta-propeller repeat
MKIKPKTMNTISRIAAYASVILLLTVQALFSQQWIQTFDGTAHQNDRVTAIATDKAGNIYVTGYAAGLTSGNDMMTRKYNASGIIQWSVSYNGPGNSDDKAWGIVVDDNVNIIITGYSTGVGSGKDFTTIKYSSAGTQLWVSRYNEPGNGDDRAFGIVVDRIGNIYVTGYIARIGTDVYTIKYNPSGVYVWGQLINGSGNGDDGAFGIVVDSPGNNIFICGYIDNDTTGTDFLVANYDSTGNRRWLRSLSGQGGNEDKAFGIVQDQAFIYVTGHETDSIHGMNYLTVKLNYSGDTIWTSSYNGTGEANDRAFGIVVDAEGFSYVTGYSTGPNSNTDYLTIRYKPEGQVSWVSRYEPVVDYHDTACGIYLSKNNEFLYITGGSSSDTVPGKLDIASLKYSAKNGEQLQVARYGGAANLSDAATCITADTSRHIFVGGYTTTTNNGEDWLTMKYQNGEIISVELISSAVPKNFALHQNYPNPFNPVTKITFDLMQASKVRLTIYDILGREVKLLINEQLRAGTYEVSFVPENLATGIYFYELYSEGFKDTKKMTMIK